jgi:hypothetical protein
VTGGPERRRRPRRRVNRRRTLVLAASAIVVFALGVALGQVIEDNGGNRGNVTYERTLTIRPVPDTVTVTSP